jgi:TonB family protein
MMITLLLLVLASDLLSAGEDVTVHVQLFQGGWAEDHPQLKDVSILTASAYPAIKALEAKLDSPQPELTAAIIDALIEAQDLKTVDEYFSFSQKWNGCAGNFSHGVEHKLYRFKFAYVPKRVSPNTIELKIVIYKSERGTAPAGGTTQKTAEEVPKSATSGGRMDKLLDTKLLLEFDNPMIVGMPCREETYFMLIYARRASEALAPKARGPAKSGKEPAGPIEPPKELHTIIPAYPEELRQRGVKGQVGLEVAVDEKGTAIQVKVAKPLHPYLDFAAVQAVRQWTFEPAVRGGKPIPVIVKIFVSYDPETYRRFEEKARLRTEEETGGAQAASSPLGEILAGAADYCQKLAGASLDFICEEAIKEVHYNFETDPKWAGLAVASKETGEVSKVSWFPQWDPGRTQKSDYVCDYLFIRKGEKLEERRIILKDNGRIMEDRSRLLEEKRFTALNPILAAVQLLGRDQQSSYDFRLIDTDRLNGRRAFVLEIIPKAGNTWGIEYAKLWVDQAGFQVLKGEIQGIPLEGYDDVLKDAVQFRVRPYLLTTHNYDFEKNGVRFPSRSTIRVEYPRRGDFYKDRTLKMKIDMTYNKYKFFTVETETGIKR